MNSITSEKDSVILKGLISLHGVKDPYIVDATYGKGVMWKDCSFQPHVRMDLRSMPNVNHIGDFKVMAGIEDQSVDVLVFDPPHLPNHAGTKSSSKVYGNNYGLTDIGDVNREGDNVFGLFDPFLLQAKRVLRREGILLTKICDLTHNHRYQWQQVEFVNCVQRMGMTPCDMVIKQNKTKLLSSKWKNSFHVLKMHSYWIVVRPGKCCERKK